MKPFLANLDTPGGQVLCAFALILVGAALYRIGTPKAEDVLPFALGIMARSMLGRNGHSFNPPEGKP